MTSLPFGNHEIGLGVAPYVEEDRAFVDAVIEGRDAEPGLHQALVAHRLVDAAYRSAAAGGAPVEIG